MNIKIQTCIDGNVLTFSADVEQLKELTFRRSSVNSLDDIVEVFITKDMVITTTKDRDFRNGSKTAPFVKNEREKNNIDAYDWDGNHLWNIADIVGDIKMAFYGGNLCTKESLKGLIGYDESKMPEGRVMFSCIAGGVMYIIDLVDNQLCQKICNIK